MTNGNDSAYPEIRTDLDTHNSQASGDTYSIGGLTKREHFAAMAMQGIVADAEIPEWFADDYARAAERSVQMADALIEALNKEATR